MGTYLLLNPRRRRRFGQQLCVAGIFHQGKEGRCFVDSATGGKKSVVLKNRTSLVAQGFGNSPALGGFKDNSTKHVVDGVIVVESACVLVQHVEGEAEA